LHAQLKQIESGLDKAENKDKIKHHLSDLLAERALFGQHLAELSSSPSLFALNHLKWYFILFYF